METDNSYKFDHNDLILLNELKERIGDVDANPRYKEDRFLIRWLRARNMNVDQAEQMLRKSLDWRESSKIEKLAENYEPSEGVSNYLTGGWFGHDKDGCSVYYNPVGKLDFAGCYRSVSKKYLINHYMAALEIKQIENNNDQVAMVVDFDGFGMTSLMSPVMKYFTIIFALTEANYPETLKFCYVVNVPRIWSLIFQLVKPFLSEHTQSKISLLRENWKPKLLEVIDADQLPKYFGGDACDPDGDPFCKSKICWGGIVPKSYYLNQQEFSDPSKLTNLSIKHGDILNLEYEVYNHDCTLNYYFKTHSHDIKFGISYRKSEFDEYISILPIELYDSHIIPEFSSISCDKLGMYYVHFDNRYSWTKNKEVSYFIDIVQTCNDGAF